jgi:hypothetical protein
MPVVRLSRVVWSGASVTPWMSVGADAVSVPSSAVPFAMRERTS